ncbi:uncharacterized protein LOC135926367 isoform X2 [Gordionus sp. m RMFG-2023]|uniref:uncharacterized protein LOC135926367 isoform X2 n=1 Tax=Gordionus sp. m RMFG-2023 TaxID=3053472 RepID=UPI0031FCF07A
MGSEYPIWIDVILLSFTFLARHSLELPNKTMYSKQHSNALIISKLRSELLNAVLPFSTINPIIFRNQPNKLPKFTLLKNLSKFEDISDFKIITNQPHVFIHEDQINDNKNLLQDLEDVDNYQGSNSSIFKGALITNKFDLMYPTKTILNSTIFSNTHLLLKTINMSNMNYSHMKISNLHNGGPSNYNATKILAAVSKKIEKYKKSSFSNKSRHAKKPLKTPSKMKSNKGLKIISKSRPIDLMGKNSKDLFKNDTNIKSRVVKMNNFMKESYELLKFRAKEMLTKIVTNRIVINSTGLKKIKFGPCTYQLTVVSDCEFRTYTKFLVYNLVKGDNRICDYVKVKETLCQDPCKYEKLADGDAECDIHTNVRKVRYHLISGNDSCSNTVVHQQWCRKCIYIPNKWGKCDNRTRIKIRNYTLLKEKSSLNLCAPKSITKKCHIFKNFRTIDNSSDCSYKESYASDCDPHTGTRFKILTNANYLSKSGCPSKNVTETCRIRPCRYSMWKDVPECINGSVKAVRRLVYGDPKICTKDTLKYPC